MPQSWLLHPGVRCIVWMQQSSQTGAAGRVEAAVEDVQYRAVLLYSHLTSNHTECSHVVL